MPHIYTKVEKESACSNNQLVWVYICVLHKCTEYMYIYVYIFNIHIR